MLSLECHAYAMNDIRSVGPDLEVLPLFLTFSRLLHMCCVSSLRYNLVIVLQSRKIDIAESPQIPHEQTPIRRKSFGGLQHVLFTAHVFPLSSSFGFEFVDVFA